MYNTKGLGREHVQKGVLKLLSGYLILIKFYTVLHYSQHVLSTPLSTPSKHLRGIRPLNFSVTFNSLYLQSDVHSGSKA